MINFIPDLHAPDSTVPYFEDNQELKIPGRGTEKTLANLEQEITQLLTRLGAYQVSFVPGKATGIPTRYGFQINFRFANGTGRITVAALPLRSETQIKKTRALAQALYLFRDKLQAQVYASVYEPGSIPLIPYLIGTGGKTVTEALFADGSLPQLTSGK